MKLLAFAEPTASTLVEAALRKYGASTGFASEWQLPPEDYFIVSRKCRAAVVADGVTIIARLYAGRDYPNPSPALKAAKCFCRAFIHQVEKAELVFEQPAMERWFRVGNSAVRKYNQSVGRNASNIDYWEHDFFATTAASWVQIGHHVYWGAIGDSRIAMLDNCGGLTFCSPVDEPSRLLVDAAVEEEGKERAQYLARTLRNRVDAFGNPCGYGVCTGEPAATRYLHAGVAGIHPGSLVVAMTDGFTEYLKLQRFRTLLADWPNNLETQLRELTREMSGVDPYLFGHERSLVAMKL